MSKIEQKTCPQCGAPFTLGSPESLCPRCVMKMNLATQTEFTDDAEPDGRSSVTYTPEEIAKHFPQLEIIECLGRGGMGVVYKARQKSLDRLVALKILAPEREADSEFADRFSHEAKLLAALSHPNIVTIHDFGETDGLYYLVMEFVDGVNLRTLLRDRHLAPEEALAIVSPICEALQCAHDRGVVHRDIKPENLLLGKDGQIKIADFGIAKILGRTGSEISEHSSAKKDPQAEPSRTAGTPRYMAPEQKSTAQKIDHRADIYSLGVVLYEMLTGQTPENDIQPPSKKVLVDVRIDEIVLRALEREPEKRYQTATQFKTQVECTALASSSIIAKPDKTKPLPRWIENWIAVPTEQRRLIFRVMLMAGILMTIVFCWPTWGTNSEGERVIASYGLGFPWIEITEGRLLLNRTENPHLSSISFLAGLLACFNWLVLGGIFSYAEWRASDRLSLKDRVFYLVLRKTCESPSRLHWKNLGLLIIVNSFYLLSIIFMAVAFFGAVLLGKVLSPLIWLIPLGNLLAGLVIATVSLFCLKQRNPADEIAITNSVRSRNMKGIKLIREGILRVAPKGKAIIVLWRDALSTLGVVIFCLFFGLAVSIRYIWPNAPQLMVPFLALVLSVIAVCTIVFDDLMLPFDEVNGNKSEAESAHSRELSKTSGTGNSNPPNSGLSRGFLQAAQFVVVPSLIIFLLFAGVRFIQQQMRQADRAEVQAILNSYTFGPVVEREIQYRDSGTNLFLDVDTGEFLTPPPEIAAALESDEMENRFVTLEQRGAGSRNGEGTQSALYLEWLKESGVDLLAYDNQQLIELFLYARSEKLWTLERWNTLTAKDVAASVSHGSYTMELWDGTLDRRLSMPKDSFLVRGDRLPKIRKWSSDPLGGLLSGRTNAWSFITREGRMGFLQIYEEGILESPGMDEPADSVRIRYRLLEKKSH